jgi:uncharacterized protein YhbP (UPF0306 family)
MSSQPQPVEIPQQVIDYLASEQTMTLATSTPGGIPYATSYLYVNDGPTLYFWSRSTTIASRHIELNPMVAFTIDSYSGDLSELRGVQGTGECSVILSGLEIARVADLFGQRFPDLAPGSTMSISFFRIVPTNLAYIDNTREGASAAAGTFGAEFHKQRAYSVFAGLPNDPVDTITAEMRSVRHSAGEVISRSGGPADKFFVVVEGEVEVEQPEGAESGDGPQVLGPGSFFGEVSILRDTPRIATLKARTDVALLAMERDEFQAMVAQALGTTADFADVLRARLRALSSSAA